MYSNERWAFSLNRKNTERIITQRRKVIAVKRKIKCWEKRIRNYYIRIKRIKRKAWTAIKEVYWQNTRVREQNWWRRRKRINEKKSNIVIKITKTRNHLTKQKS